MNNCVKVEPPDLEESLSAANTTLPAPVAVPMLTPIPLQFTDQHRSDHNHVHHDHGSQHQLEHVTVTVDTIGIASFNPAVAAPTQHPSLSEYWSGIAGPNPQERLSANADDSLSSRIGAF